MVVQGVRRGASAPVATCIYPGARLACRQPRRALDEPFVAVLGGGTALARPGRKGIAEEIEARLGVACVDFSAAHAGPDAYLADSGLMMNVQRARAVVLTVPGAHALRNPYYTVHRWSNDRVIGQTDKLRWLFPELDLFSYAYVRHMLGDMQACSPERFAEVRDTLRQTWSDRMEALIGQFDVPVIALWTGSRDTDAASADRVDLDPPLVTREMLDRLPVDAVVVTGRGRKLLSAPRRRSLSRVEEAGEKLATVIAELAGLGTEHGNEKGPRRSEALLRAVGAQAFSVSSGMATKRSATSP